MMLYTCTFSEFYTNNDDIMGQGFFLMKNCVWKSKAAIETLVYVLMAHCFFSDRQKLYLDTLCGDLRSFYASFWNRIRDFCWKVYSIAYSAFFLRNVKTANEFEAFESASLCLYIWSIIDMCSRKAGKADILYKWVKSPALRHKTFKFSK
jgi:hypothetical protein